MTENSLILIALLPLLLMTVLMGLLAVMIVAWCKLFSKAGIHPGKFFIPGYGGYLSYKMANSTGLFFAQIALSAVYSIVAGIMSASLTTITRRSYGSYRYTTGINEGALAAYLVVMGIFVIVTLVLTCIYSVRLGRAFGKSGGFLVGMVLLFPIFLCILGFGDAQFQGEKGDYVPAGKGRSVNPDAEPAYLDAAEYRRAPVDETSSAPEEITDPEAWTCPDCGNVNRPEARFCTTCGRQR